MSAPLCERLTKYARLDRVSFSMPGHKGRADFSGAARCDVTELEATADLHAESEAVSEANALLARLYGADRSFILTGGSTAAVHAMIAASVRRGETLLVTSDCHMSVINYCAIAGINLRMADKEYNAEFMISGGISSVLKYLDSCPDIRAVLITSPNYYGICSDTRRIARECHAHGKPLLADEAHGAHFAASDLLPESAAGYADIVCQSAHKTLNALTGAAYLHVRRGIVDPEKVRRCVNMIETSSPSYAVAASADTAREEIAGENGWNETVNLCEKFKSAVSELNIAALENDDMTRVVLNFKNYAVTGYEAERLLSKRGIDIEAADLKNIILIVTPNNTAGDFKRLYAALKEITENTAEEKFTPRPFLPPPRNGLIRPHDAFYADGATVPLEKSAGYVSRATVTAYPPGIPLIAMGETITEEHIGAVLALRGSGAKITGMNGGEIDTVK